MHRDTDNVLADLLESEGHHVEAGELRRADAAVLTCSLRDWLDGRSPRAIAERKARELLSRR